MITIKRVVDPTYVTAFTPYIVLESEQARLEYVAQLADALRKTPEQLLVLAALRDDELLAFVVCQSTPGDFVWVSQVWSKNTNSWKIIDAMWTRVLVWCAALGKRAVRAETKREPGPYLRRFDMQPVVTILEHELAPDLLDTIVRSVRNPVEV